MSSLVDNHSKMNCCTPVMLANSGNLSICRKTNKIVDIPFLVIHSENLGRCSENLEIPYMFFSLASVGVVIEKGMEDLWGTASISLLLNL